MGLQRYGVAFIGSAALVALAGTAAAASPGTGRPGAEPLASVSALHSHVVHCSNGSTIRVLTPPAGHRMPITALMRSDSPAFVRQERPSTHWLVPGCQSTDHRGSPSVPDNIPATSETDSPNWSGFQTTAYGFTLVQGQWTVPSVGTNTTDSAFSSIWPGLGDGNTDGDILVQAGTEQDAGVSPEIGGTSTQVDYAWYEIVPIENQIKLKGFTISPGNVVFFSVSHTGSGQALIDAYNSSGNQSSVFYVTWGTKYTLQGDAEWIVERTEESGYYPQLALFGTVTISDAEAVDGAGAQNGVGNFHRDFYWMTNCADNEYLAKTGDIDSSGTSFPVNWENYGPDQKACPNNA
jgi:hypothetical protein